MNIATTFEDKVAEPPRARLSHRASRGSGPCVSQEGQAFQNWLEKQSYVTSNNSVIDILKSMNRSSTLTAGFYKLPEVEEATRSTCYTMSLPQEDVNDRVSVKSDAIGSPRPGHS